MSTSDSSTQGALNQDPESTNLKAQPSTSNSDDVAHSTEGGSHGGTTFDYVKSIRNIPSLFNLEHLRSSSNSFRNRFLPNLYMPTNPAVAPDRTSEGDSITRTSIVPEDNAKSDPVDQTTIQVPSTLDGQQGLFLDLTDLGSTITANAGPSVHISTNEVDHKELEGSQSKESSDDESGPPVWITRKVSTPRKAPMVNPTIFGEQLNDHTTIIANTKSRPVITSSQSQTGLDSQALLRAQLLKSQVQESNRREENRSISMQASCSSISSLLTPTNRNQIIPQPDSSEISLPVLNARKYYILTSAGKPVWSTEEDCDDKEGGDTTGLMGLMQAVISIFEDDGDELRYIDSGSVKIAVMLKAPLYLLAVSNWGEPESTLRLHLEYLHLLIQSILSLTQLQQMFERRSNYDLRRTLSGTESIFRGMVDRLQWDFSIMMSCLEVFNCNPEIRDRIGKIVTPIGLASGSNQKIKSIKRKQESESMAMDEEEDDDLNLDTVAHKLLYSIVLVNGKVACLVRPKQHSVHPSDLHLIITTVLSSYSLKTSESWIPICLPGYNSTGFLHAYISFLPEPKSSIGLIFVSGDRTGFFKLKKWLERIQNDEIWNELLLNLESEGNGYSLEQVGIPGLRHFVFKHKVLVQVSFPIWEDDYLHLEDRRRLVTTYQKAYDLMHPKLSRVKDDKRPPITFIYLRNEGEAIIGWNTSTHELYMAVSPMLSKSAAVSAAHSVVKWVKTRESSLFLTSAPAF